MKNRFAAALLAWFLGGFGGHKFYLGNTKSGVFRLLFFWTMIPSFLAIYDLIVLLFMDDKTFNEKYNNTNKNK